MEYRNITPTQQVSTIGLGGTHFHEIPGGELERLVDTAVEQGVNLIDFATSYAEPIVAMGPLLKGKRKQFLYQMHLGLTFPGGQYARTRDLTAVRQGFEEQLKQLGTDYTDIAFLHCVDEPEDYEAVFSSGVYDYALSLKQQGKARYIGFASHTVDICHRFLQDAAIDICMFSVNPAYDLDPVGNVPFDEIDMTGQDQLTVSQSRFAFYRECERRGVGIQVMKPYGGGLLLQDETSPFGKAMTIPQCLAYALDRPAVLSCLLGVRSVQDLQDALAYYAATKEERDYAFVAKLRHKDMQGTCVYCNHCLPCPAGIDIGAVHKYLDLSLAGDDLAREHYKSLRKNASHCINCGSCERGCPFHVEVRAKMRQAVAAFQ